MTEERSPVFNAPPAGSSTCPRCGRTFERGFKIGDVQVRGHVIGDPILCVPLEGVTLARDARDRRALRRGQ